MVHSAGGHLLQVIEQSVTCIGNGYCACLICLVDFVGRHNKIVEVHRLICSWCPADIVATKKGTEVEKIDTDSVCFSIFEVV